MSSSNNEKSRDDVIRFIRDRAEQAFQKKSIDSLNISYGTLVMALYLQIITSEEFKILCSEIWQYMRALRESKKNKRRIDDPLYRNLALIIAILWLLAFIFSVSLLIVKIVMIVSK